MLQFCLFILSYKIPEQFSCQWWEASLRPHVRQCLSCCVAFKVRRQSELLQQHHVIVRRELARFRGREVNTAGDGFLIAFDGPGRAIRCGISISRQVRALGVEIKAGLHSGECETVGNDLGGLAVHIGSRIASTAKPGEILVSSTVKDLVAGSNIKFKDQGSRAFKGLDDKVRLFEAMA